MIQPEQTWVTNRQFSAVEDVEPWGPGRHRATIWSWRGTAAVAGLLGANESRSGTYNDE